MGGGGGGAVQGGLGNHIKYLKHNDNIFLFLY